MSWSQSGAAPGPQSGEVKDSRMSLALERYRAEHSSLHHAEGSRKIVDTVVRGFVSHLETAIGSRDPLMSEIGRKEVLSFQRYRFESKISPSTVNKEIRHLRAFFRWCETEHLLALDPTRGVKLLRTIKRTAEEKIVEPEALGKFLAFVDSRRDTLYGDLARLIANTGLRLGEALWLRAKDVNLEAHRLTVRNQEGHALKDKEDRMIPLNEVALEVVGRRVGEAKKRAEKGGPSIGDRYLFPCQKCEHFVESEKPYSVDAISQGMRHRREKADTPGLDWYGLRHTFATRMAEHLTPYQLMVLMGHSCPQTTAKFYVHRDAMRIPTPPPQS